MSHFVFKKQVEEYVLISRCGQMIGEQFEIRLLAGDEWIAFLNFRHSKANPIDNHRNAQGIPELFVPPEQYLGTIDMLRHEQPVWFTLYEEPMVGWLSTSAEPVGTEDELS